MRRGISFFLFLTSYTPLFLAFAIKNAHPTGDVFSFLERNPFLMIVVVLSIILVLSARWIFSVVGTAGKTTITFTVVERKDQDVLSYVVTYLVPFMGLSLSSTPEIVANLMLVLVMGFLYVRSNLIYINPVLSFLGYSIYEGIDQVGNHNVIISRQKLLPGVHHLTHLDDRIYLDVLK